MASLATKPVEGGDPHGQEHPSLLHHYSGLHLSRLSMCTKGETTTAHIDIDDADDKHYDGDDDYDNDDDDQDDHDNEEEEEVRNGEGNSNTSPPDSDHSKEAATTPRWRWRWRRRRRGGLKEYYASENEAQQQKKGINKEIMKRRGWMERAAAAGIVTRYGNDDDDDHNNSNHLIINNSSRSTGESECFVITRPKGGRRSLCMDLEEVKACRDLGLELDRISLMSMSPTNSTIDYYTSCSGGNSPIASLGRISSSPGDDPRDVKARLKKWAQMVALATATR